jgi:hypothetical protein
MELAEALIGKISLTIVYGLLRDVSPQFTAIIVFTSQKE